MVKIQKRNKQFTITIPKITAKFVKLKKGEEVLLSPKENGDIIIMRTKEETNN